MFRFNYGLQYTRCGKRGVTGVNHLILLVNSKKYTYTQHNAGTVQCMAYGSLDKFYLKCD